MTESNGKKSKKQRYDGVDPISWKVSDSNGKQVGTDTYPGYKEANTAAQRYADATGQYAGAVRT